MSVALAFERRRAHAHRLLVHIRRFAALDVVATVRLIPSETNTSETGSRKYDPFYDEGQSVLARLEEKHLRSTRHRNPPGSSQDPSTSQCAAPHPSCRGDADDAFLVMHDSTLHGAVLFPKKQV